MTWQRIDENTYIDDTLVTCAEYQLFIDEMREQGKYYQPDHWTSDQFLDGQALEPVLGVRHSDAIAFCEWLSNREGREWLYRLPNEKEADTFSTKTNREQSIGFWITSSDHKTQFKWIGSILHDVRGIDRTRILSEYPRSTAGWALDVDAHFMHSFDRSRSLTLDLDLVYALTSGLDVMVEIPFDINGSRYHVYDFVDAVYGIRDRVHISNNLVARERLLKLAIALAHIVSMEIFIELFTLRERIARRSPAFEGIRLAKERIR